MFDKSVYVNRRKQLIDKMSGGLVLILGNEEAPANYPSNTYKFRQDSSFLYFFGLNMPGFAGLSHRTWIPGTFVCTGTTWTWTILFGWWDHNRA